MEVTTRETRDLLSSSSGDVRSGTEAAFRAEQQDAREEEEEEERAQRLRARKKARGENPMAG